MVAGLAGPHRQHTVAEMSSSAGIISSPARSWSLPPVAQKAQRRAYIMATFSPPGDILTSDDDDDDEELTQLAGRHESLLLAPSPPPPRTDPSAARPTTPPPPLAPRDHDKRTGAIHVCSTRKKGRFTTLYERAQHTSDKPAFLLEHILPALRSAGTMRPTDVVEACKACTLVVVANDSCALTAAGHDCIAHGGMALLIDCMGGEHGELPGVLIEAMRTLWPLCAFNQNAFLVAGGLAAVVQVRQPVVFYWHPLGHHHDCTARCVRTVRTRRLWARTTRSRTCSYMAVRACGVPWVNTTGA
jgi:hypothetical protein